MPYDGQGVEAVASFFELSKAHLSRTPAFVFE